MKKIIVIIGLVLKTAILLNAQNVTVSLTPVKDNSIFSENSNNSNGIGKVLFAGRTKGIQATENRRALLKFNLSSIPSNAIIQTVNLQVAVVKSSDNISDFHSFSIHKLLNDWGESSSTGLGKGGPAQTNDATWHYKFYASSTWTTDGGDFVNTPSATSLVSYSDFDLQFGVWSSAAMKSDVTSWLTNTLSNFGWIIVGEENTLGSAKGFASREETVFPKPTLSITYSLPVDDKTLINEVNPQQKWIEIYNPSAQNIDLSSYWLCNGNSVDAVNTIPVLNGDLQLSPNEYVVLGWTNMAQNDGEIALFNNNPSSGGTMKDYLQYGTGNHQRASLAVSSLVWDNANLFLPTISTDTTTYSLKTNKIYPLGGKSSISTDWALNPQTPTYKNDICGQALALTGTMLSATYKSASEINVKGSIANGKTVKINSPTFILFEGVFSAENGSTLEAKIAPCSN